MDVDVPFLRLRIRKPLGEISASDLRAFVFFLLVVELTVCGHFMLIELCWKFLEELTISFKCHLEAFDANFMPRLESLLLECVNVGSEQEQVLVKCIVGKCATITHTCLQATSLPVHLVVTSREFVQGCTHGVQVFLYVVRFVEEASATLDESIDVMEPLGNCIILEGKMSSQHELAKFFLIFLLLSFETRECQVLHAQNGKLTFNGWFIDDLGDPRDIATQVSGQISICGFECSRLSCTVHKGDTIADHKH